QYKQYFAYRSHSPLDPYRDKALPKCLRMPSTDAMVYVCGPNGQMERVSTEAFMHGWRPEQIKSEAFIGEDVGLQSFTMRIYIAALAVIPAVIASFNRSVATRLQAVATGLPTHY
ncbi:hypothetical protein PQR53_37340, partial [Paraburkholderia fungorum]